MEERAICRDPVRKEVPFKLDPFFFLLLKGLDLVEKISRIEIDSVSKTTWLIRITSPHFTDRGEFRYLLYSKFCNSDVSYEHPVPSCVALERTTIRQLQTRV